MIKVDLGGIRLSFNSNSKRLTNPIEVQKQIQHNADCAMGCKRRASIFLESGEIYVCRNCYEVFNMVRKIVRRVSFPKLIMYAVVDALRSSGFSQKKAAKKIGISPRAINYWVQKCGFTHKSWSRNSSIKSQKTAKGIKYATGD